MKRYALLALVLLVILLALPHPGPVLAQATSTFTPTPTSTMTATSTPSPSATAAIWYYATSEAGQGWRVEYSANLGDVAEFIIRSIIIALALAGLMLVLHERK